MVHSVKYLDYQIKVYTEGKGEILLFLHGWPTNSRLWKSQIDRFKATYRVVTIDWLGFGQSDKPDHHVYTFARKKEMLDVVLADLLEDNELINIIAHDIGGPPAVLWAHEHQDQVKRLILLNTIVFPFSTFLDKISHTSFGIPLLNKLLVSNFYLKNLMKSLTKSKGKEVNKRISAVLDWHEDLSGKIKLKAILEPMNEGRRNELLSLEAKLKQLRAQKYLIIAREDPLCYAHMRKLKNNNPDLPSFVIDNCGHYLPFDKPNALNGILLEILEND